MGTHSLSKRISLQSLSIASAGHCWSIPSRCMEGMDTRSPWVGKEVFTSKECAVLLIGEDARVGMDGWVSRPATSTHTYTGRSKEGTNGRVHGRVGSMDAVGRLFVRSLVGGGGAIVSRDPSFTGLS